MKPSVRRVFITSTTITSMHATTPTAAATVNAQAEPCPETASAPNSPTRPARWTRATSTNTASSNNTTTVGRTPQRPPGWLCLLTSPSMSQGVRRTSAQPPHVAGNAEDREHEIRQTEHPMAHDEREVLVGKGIEHTLVGEPRHRVRRGDHTDRSTAEQPVLGSGRDVLWPRCCGAGGDPEPVHVRGERDHREERGAQRDQ